MFNTVFRSTCAAAAILAVPAVATAAPFEYSGNVKYEMVSDGGGFSGNLVSGKLDFSADNLMGDIGVEGSVFAVGSPSSNFEFGGNVALTYTSDFGKFSFGLPASAAKGATHLPSIGQYSVFDEFAAGLLVGDVISYLTFLGPFEVYGVRYDGSFGNLNLSTSAHTEGSGSDVIATAAVSYESGNVFVVGTIEGSPMGGPVFYHVEAGTDNGTTSFGVGASGVTMYPASPMYMAWATYDPTDALSISAIVTNDSVTTGYSLGARYDFANGFYGTAGAIEDGSGIAYVLGAGFAF